MLQSYFDSIFVHVRQKVRLRTQLSPKFLSTLSPNLKSQKARPDLQLWLVPPNHANQLRPNFILSRNIQLTSYI